MRQWQEIQTVLWKVGGSFATKEIRLARGKGALESRQWLLCLRSFFLLRRLADNTLKAVTSYLLGEPLRAVALGNGQSAGAGAENTRTDSVLSLADGKWPESEFSIKPSNSEQNAGAAATFGRAVQSASTHSRQRPPLARVAQPSKLKRSPMRNRASLRLPSGSPTCWWSFSTSALPSSCAGWRLRETERCHARDEIVRCSKVETL